MKMTMIAAVLQWMWARGLIHDNREEYSGGHLWGPGEELYMGRWSIIEKGTRASKLLAFLTGGAYDHARLHWIRVPDRDRELHDHPFNYCTFVLEGWYVEQYIPHQKVNAAMLRTWQGSSRTMDVTALSNVTETRRLGAGDYMRAEEGQFHRIASVNDGGVWTLFFMGRDTGKWGFLVDGRWMKSHSFFRMKQIDRNGHALPA